MDYLVSIHYNNTDLLEFQYETIKKYVRGHYKFIVFNDEPSNSTKIFTKCNDLNITTIRIPQEIHINRNLVFKNPLCKMRKIMNNSTLLKNATTDKWLQNLKFQGHNSILNNTAGSRHSDSIQYIVNYFLDKDVNLLISIDADMLLVGYINFSNYIQDNCISTYWQGRKYINNSNWLYIWTNLFIINYKKCPNLSEISFDGVYLFDNDNLLIDRTDTGGETGNYLQKYKNVLKLGHMHCKCVITLEDMNIYKKEINNKNINNYLDEINELNDRNGPDKELFFDNCLLHLRGFGSNWKNYKQDYIDRQLNIFKKNFM